ncbi:hypothetical protein [Klebsiella aerogenes]|uniref:Spy/CpxP family protein refolding chaperone n=1 Tax=Klebsiella aerogenes TaxID=548 RepID=UPI00207424E7|nr:hypothetical protein [Klebsiella aerogenes]
MNTFLRNTLAAVVMTAGLFVAAQAATTAEVPPLSQDPVVQHLKLSNDQVSKIQALRQELETNLKNIKIGGYQDGALVGVIQSGKWDDAKVKQQLAAFAQLDQQTRYYRVKYYFGINQVLTAEQREQVKKDLQQALN